MAVLVNGDGNKAIWAQQDADLIASLAGNVTAIADVGSKFAATQEDANTIGLADGVIVTKEGRRIQLNVGNTDLFDIPTGTAGVTSYYIIGYHLYTQSDTSQVCETFVQKMDNATDVITENTFRGGATEVYVSCYRVIQTGLNITAINALLPNIESLSELKSALVDYSWTNISDAQTRTTQVSIPNNAKEVLIEILDYTNSNNLLQQCVLTNQAWLGSQKNLYYGGMLTTANYQGALILVSGGKFIGCSLYANGAENTNIRVSVYYR